MPDSPQEPTPEPAPESPLFEPAPSWPPLDPEGAELPEPADEPTPPEPVAPPAPEKPPPPPLRIVEALLFVGGPPLTAARAGELIRGLQPEQFTQLLETLNESYRQQGRPYQIQSQGEGWVLSLRPRYRGVAERLFGGVRAARLSPTAIDVLALVAYRQPATKQEIDSIRGAESGSLLRQLVRHGLIAVKRGEAGQKEVSYLTTARFLELFGLASLEDLPQTQDLRCRRAAFRGNGLAFHQGYSWPTTSCTSSR
jgi:segregation and condensation protein B